MTFKLGDFFPKKTVDEPFLGLNDPRWEELEGGYRGVCYDASKALKRLEAACNVYQTQEIYLELWVELHHQGDVGIASYYAVPHMVRIAKENGIIDWNVLGLVSLIEIQRHKDNPTIPKALYTTYQNTLSELSGIAASILSENWDLSTASAALTAIAIAKGHIKLGNAIQNLDSEDQIDEFLDQY
ncbi:hypothetical protein [Mucilaginibacter psychrotolerans]|uniref:Uncharacterized protein n=1 Tax=Mucilaginibacter psychrotolerans TaxID=1524096 RepID=A0A4Y8SPE5_9SPHI|nr:hypothetical protein [Mucilaginibacter psychrotolerans]TFF40798.1 hypothetical protein E2R66_01055 [Mucilaginibacter psychrotolerans]